MHAVVVVRQRPHPVVGVCGPVPDRSFSALEAELDWLELHGVPVERIDPDVEASLEALPEAARIWKEAGPPALPLLLVNGHVVSQGRRPLHHELIRLAATVVSCSSETLRHVAALATAAALGQREPRTQARAQAEADGLTSAQLDAVEDEARRVAHDAALVLR
jgi:hypothetical protein